MKRYITALLLLVFASAGSAADGSVAQHKQTQSVEKSIQAGGFSSQSELRHGEAQLSFIRKYSSVSRDEFFERTLLDMENLNEKKIELDASAARR